MKPQSNVSYGNQAPTFVDKCHQEGCPLSRLEMEFNVNPQITAISGVQAPGNQQSCD